MSPLQSSPEAPDDDAAAEAAAQVKGRRRLLFVAFVLAAEAVALFGVTVFLTANLIGGSEETTETRNTVIGTIGFFVFGLILLLLAWGALRAKGWMRGPTIVVQLLAFSGVAINLVQGDLWYSLPIGIPLTAGNILATLALLTPSVTAALDLDRS